MKKTLLTIAMTLLSMAMGYSAKSLYIPNEWKNFNSSDTLLYKQTDTSNQYTWSKSRSLEGDNVIIYWDKNYGSTRPDQLSTSSEYYVDINDLLEKCEEFFALESSTLGFVDPATSNVKNYKIMVLLNHTTDWICYGGGYDYKIPALWLSPSTCHPVGSAVAHEVGHSFHYMCYGEDSNYGSTSGVETGFHSAVGNGQCIWETTANWQALQSYPGEVFTESGTVDIFQKSHNYAFSHEWHRYQAYMFLNYITQYYNDVKTVANVWNTHETSVVDFNQALMDCKSLSVSQLYRLHFDFAMRAATYDMDVCAPYLNDSYIGKFNWNYVKLSTTKYQVAYSSVPQSTGFNVIELSVPTAGTEVTTKFTALVPGCSLASGDPAEYLDGNSVYSSSSSTTYNSMSTTQKRYRGFRLGYVVLKKDGTRVYYDDNTIHCYNTSKYNQNITENVTYTVPANAKRMWLVVCPTPSTYIQHKWDENISNDDQWPYQVEFENTNLKEFGMIDGRDIADVEFTYDVTLPPTSDHTAAIFYMDETAKSALSLAFQLTISDIQNKLTTSTTSGPSNDQIMGFPFTVSGNTKTINHTSTTAAGDFGYWFNASEGVTNWGSNSVIFGEFYKNSMEFRIGQYPNANSDGGTRTVHLVMEYKNSSGQTAKAYFTFNVTFATGATASSTMTSIVYDGEEIYPDEEDPEPTIDPNANRLEINYDVTLKPVDGYDGATITMSDSNQDMAAILEFFGLSSSDGIASLRVDYSAEGPSNGQIMNYAVDSSLELQSVTHVGNTNGTFGHWFQSDGTATTWGNSSVAFAEYTFVSGSTKSVTIGQMPNQNSDGDVRTIREALVYKTSTGDTKIAYLIYTITFDSSANSNTSTIGSIDAYTEEETLPSVDLSVTVPRQTVESESKRISYTNEDVAKLGLTIDEIASIGLTTPTTAGPASGQIMLYPVDSSGNVLYSQGVTAADNGHWYNESGAVCTDNGTHRIAARFDWIARQWVIYQNPGTLTVGDSYTMREALVYNNGSDTKTLVFNINVDIEALQDKILYDNATVYDYEPGIFNVTLSRTFKTGSWLTFCAPFNIPSSYWEGMGIDKVLCLASYRDYGDDKSTMIFEYITDGMWVGKVYLIKMAEAKTGITMTETAYNNMVSTPTESVGNGSTTVSMIGTHIKTTVPLDAYVLSNGLVYVNNRSDLEMNGWRAYFTVESSGEVKSLGFETEDGELITSIEGLDVVLNDHVDVFSVSGAKLRSGVERSKATEGLPAGIYVVGGEKVVVR